MPRPATRNPHAQLSQVVTGLLAIQNGTARNQAQAAQMAGTQRKSLQPKALAALARTNPAMLAFVRLNPLEITAEVTGEGGSKRRVTMREALSTGATRCVAIMADLSPRIGDLTKEEERKYNQAARWLLMCRQIGLFGENEGAQLPGELREPAPDPTGSVQWFQQQATTGDLTGQMLTVLGDKGRNPVEDQRPPQTGNVG